MKNYSFIIFAAIACLLAIPSHAQDRSIGDAQTASPPVESLAPQQSELTSEKQPLAPDSDKCQSVDR
jgi:hypothetical protein